MNKKSFIAGMLTMALLVGMVGTAYATIGRKTVEVDYMDICLQINGELVVPRNASGEVVEPFAINGTTYLPVRAVAEALDIDVEWNPELNTVSLETSSAAQDRSGETWTAMRMLECAEELYFAPFFIGLECGIYAGSKNHNYEYVLKMQEQLTTVKSNYESNLSFLEPYYDKIPIDCKAALQKAMEYYETLISDAADLIYWFGILSSREYPSNAHDEYTAAINKMVTDYRDGCKYCIDFASEFIKNPAK